MRQTFRPSLEALEARWVPTVTASIKNGVAYFVGDKANDLVQLVASVDGDTGDNLITATYTSNKNGSTTSTTINLTDTPLTGAWVLLNNGNDTFIFQNFVGTGFDLASNFDLAVGLGDGNNSADIAMTANVTGGALVNLNVAGGKGRDNLAVNFFGNIDEGSTVTARVDGGKGNDTITINHNGVVQGNASFLVIGGGDNDVIQTSFYAVAPGTEGATGNIDVAITGSKQKNRLSLLAAADEGASVNAFLKVYANKDDIVRITDGVFVYGAKGKNVTKVAFDSFA